MTAALVCPRCATTHGDRNRFCARCGMPLVHADRPQRAVPVSAAHERARKVKRQYAEGSLVRVAVGRQLPEAELIQNLLIDEGVPSTLSRTQGFDVPEMLAAGPRDVLVPASGLVTAREVLLQAEMISDRPGPAPTSPARLLVFVVGGFLVLVLLLVLLDLLID